jgi:putative MFS transporter
VGANHAAVGVIAQRLDRLPITSLHRAAIRALAFAYFFELADIYTFSLASPGLMTYWHLSVRDVARITSATFGGAFLGAIGAGRFAEMFGRKPTLIVAILLYSLASMLCGLSWSSASLGAFRFLTGLGLAGMTVVANTYVGELFPPATRGRYLAIIVAIGLIGVPVTAWISRFVVPIGASGWRFVFLWGGLGVAVIPLVLRMTESPRWYASRGRFDEARVTVEQWEACASSEGKAPSPVVSKITDGCIGTGSFSTLLRGRLGRRTVLMLFVSALQTIGGYGFLVWAPALLVAHGFTMLRSLEYSSLIAICNPLGAAASIALIERVERKSLIAAGSVIIAALGILYGSSTQPFFIVLFGGMLVFMLQANVPAGFTYGAELYPTEVRASGVGLLYGFGRLVNIAGPFAISSLYSITGYFSIFAFIAACYLVSAVALAAFGPRTTRRSLEAI